MSRTLASSPPHIRVHDEADMFNLTWGARSELLLACCALGWAALLITSWVAATFRMALLPSSRSDVDREL